MSETGALFSRDVVDQRVSSAELAALWTELQARGELWDGMTHHHLAERYGSRLYHVAGDGWYVRAAPQVIS